MPVEAFVKEHTREPLKFELRTTDVATHGIMALGGGWRWKVLTDAVRDALATLNDHTPTHAGD